MLRESHPLRTFLAIDERPAFVEFVRSPMGRLLLFAVATGLLLPAWLVGAKDFPTASLLGVLAAAAYAHLPKHRPPILFLSTWSIALISLPLSLITCGSLMGVMIFSWMSIQFVRKHRDHFYARRPVITLLGTTIVLSLISYFSPIGQTHEVMWTFLLVFKGYLWFLAFAIVDQRSRHTSPDIVQMGVQLPFWGSSNVPYGKGAAFLRSHWSKTPDELLVTQIKGLKLLAWSLALYFLQFILIRLCTDRLDIPSVDHAVDALLDNRPYPVITGWSSIIFETTIAALSLAAGSHKIIGIARLAGFRLPRNMCRPLQSRTLAEFWNRYYFYFKELMVDFFYIPTFMKMLRNQPRFRLFFATFMAAGIGNAIFHFIRDIQVIKTLGPVGAIESFTSYIFYCLVLATGIGISQLRAKAGFKPSPTTIGRVYSFLVVWSFVVCIHIFGNETRSHTLSERLFFMASLFGAN